MSITTRFHSPGRGVRHYWRPDIHGDHCPCEKGTPAMEFVYTVHYVARAKNGLHYETKLTQRVVARDAQHARAIAQALDPDFWTTYKSPKRGRRVL